MRFVDWVFILLLPVFLAQTLGDRFPRDPGRDWGRGGWAGDPSEGRGWGDYGHKGYDGIGLRGRGHGPVALPPDGGPPVEPGGKPTPGPNIPPGGHPYPPASSFGISRP